ncbi:MAG: hypothetical protein RR135_01190 [Oscillospiraceae bacterium]
MKRLILLLITVLACTACTQNRSLTPGTSEASAPSCVSMESPPPGTVREIECAGVKLPFVEPPINYVVLGTIPTDRGFAVLYQEDMPDEFNLMYSKTKTFHTLRIQTFDGKGKWKSLRESNWHDTTAFESVTNLAAPGDGTLTFRTERYANGARATSMDFVLWLDERADALFANLPDDDRYIMWHYVALPLQGAERFEFAHIPRNGWMSEDNDLCFRLLLDDGSEYSLVVPTAEAGYDVNFFTALGKAGSAQNAASDKDEPNIEDWLNDPSKPTRKLTTSLTGRVVTLSTSKIIVTLDFENGVWKVERHYTKQMLDRQIAETTDGRRQLWIADSYNRFESPGGGDLVLLDEKGNISFLCVASDLTEAYFMGKDRIWVNNHTNMMLYDSTTGKPIDQQMEFDFGVVREPDGGEHPQFIMLGTAWDEVNGMALAVYREAYNAQYEKANAYPVMLTAFDPSGKRLFAKEAGFSVPPYQKFSLWTLELRLSGDGKVTLRDAIEGDHVTLPYLN